MNRDEECAEPNEVELSTQELVDLSLRSDAERTEPMSGPAASAPSKKQPRVTTTSGVKRRSNAAGYVAAVAGVAVIAAVAIYLIPRESTTTVLSHLPRWRALPDKDPEPIEEPMPVQDLKPVRIRNAFDRTEVFEFPPGTTQQQARDAVAEILLNRAMERQSSVASSR